MDLGGKNRGEQRAAAAEEEEEGSIKPQPRRSLFSKAARLWRKEQGLDGTEIKY